MALFVDTGVLYAQAHERSRRHRAAAAALEPVVQGALGRPVVSDYVVDEAFTLTRARTRRLPLAREVVDRLLGRADYPEVFRVLRVGPDAFDAAIACLDRYADHALSFTDATTVALMEAHGIDRLLSFDDGFDGIVERMDPAEVGAEHG